MSEKTLFFGQWLRQRRRSLDLTQTELASLVGCSTVNIRKLENGERRPSGKWLVYWQLNWGSQTMSAPLLSGSPGLMTHRKCSSIRCLPNLHPFQEPRNSWHPKLYSPLIFRVGSRLCPMKPTESIKQVAYDALAWRTRRLAAP